MRVLRFIHSPLKQIQINGLRFSLAGTPALPTRHQLTAEPVLSVSVPPKRNRDTLVTAAARSPPASSGCIAGWVYKSGTRRKPETRMAGLGNSRSAESVGSMACILYFRNLGESNAQDLDSSVRVRIHPREADAPQALGGRSSLHGLRSVQERHAGGPGSRPPGGGGPLHRRAARGSGGSGGQALRRSRRA